MLPHGQVHYYARAERSITSGNGLLMGVPSALIGFLHCTLLAQDLVAAAALGTRRATVSISVHELVGHFCLRLPP